MGLRDKLPELQALEALLDDLPGARVEVVGQAEHGKERLPLYTVTFGPQDPNAPVLLLTGGVHGLERIGSQALVDYLRSFRSSLSWDQLLHQVLETTRVVFMPIINPVGMAMHRRSNGQGIDLMRSAPVEAAENGPWYAIHRGHRFSPRLPWYRGPRNQQLPEEAKALANVIENHILPSQFSISLDVHSGFGEKDRIWFPYARTKELYPAIAETLALKRLLRDTYPRHRYLVEPQSVNYTTHGDLWDHFFDMQRAQTPECAFLPLTLELGSASWYKKNPKQLRNALGAFHPITPERTERVLRRHTPLFEFLLRAVHSQDRWLPQTKDQRSTLRREAEQRWGR